MFDLVQNEETQGFAITFPNGCMLAVRWGVINYCANNIRFNGVPNVACRDAEVSIWLPDGKQHVFETGQTIMGHQTPMQVMEWMHIASEMEAPCSE